MEVQSPEAQPQPFGAEGGARDGQAEYAQLMRLAKQHDECGKVSQGLRVREQLLLCAKRTFGDHSPELQHVCESFVIRCNQAAMSMLKDEQIDACFQLLRKADILSDKSSVLASSPAARLRCRAVTLNNLGLFYRNRGQPHAALNSLEQALEIEEATYDDHSENPSATLLNICAVLSSMGRHHEALAYARRALGSLSKRGKHAARFGSPVAPSHHTMLAVAHHSVGCQYEGIKMYAKAAEEYAAAATAARQAGSADHEYCHAYAAAVSKARASGKVHESALPQLSPESREDRMLRMRHGNSSAVSPGKGRPLTGSTNASHGLSSTPGSTFNMSRPPSARRSAGSTRRNLPKVHSAPGHRPRPPQHDDTATPQPPSSRRPQSGGATKRTHHYHGRVQAPSVRPAADAYAALGGLPDGGLEPQPPKGQAVPTSAARHAYNLVYKPAANLVDNLSQSHLEAFAELEQLSMSRLKQAGDVPHAPRRPQSSGSSSSRARARVPTPTEARLDIDVSDAMLSITPKPQQHIQRPQRDGGWDSPKKDAPDNMSHASEVSSERSGAEEVDTPMVVSPQESGDLSSQSHHSDGGHTPPAEGPVLEGVKRASLSASLGAVTDAMDCTIVIDEDLLFDAAVSATLVCVCAGMQVWPCDAMVELGVTDDDVPVAPQFLQSRVASLPSDVDVSQPPSPMSAAPSEGRASRTSDAGTRSLVPRKDLVSKVVALGAELDSLHERLLEKCVEGRARERVEREKARQKRCGAALDIQRIWRGCLGKRKWQGEQFTADEMRRIARLQMLQEQSAAGSIQRSFRVFQAKRVRGEKAYAAHVKHEEHIRLAATLIQSAAREKLAKMLLLATRDRRLDRAVRFAQSLWRGRDARTTFNLIKKEWQEKKKIIEFGSASRIQVWWRRILGRRRREETFQQQWSELVRECKPSYAASRIQMWWRWTSFERRFVASVKKVTFERARQRQIAAETERVKQLQLASVRCIQRSSRVFLSRRQLSTLQERDLERKIDYLEHEERDFASRVMQSFARIVHARKVVRRRQQEIAEYAALEAWKRSKDEQRRAEEETTRRLHLAASRIQTHWRRYHGFKVEWNRRLAELLSWEQQCAGDATRIAKIWRGYVVRRQTAPLLREQAARRLGATVIQRGWRCAAARASRRRCVSESAAVRRRRIVAETGDVVHYREAERARQQSLADHASVLQAFCLALADHRHMCTKAAALHHLRTATAARIQLWWRCVAARREVKRRARAVAASRDEEEEAFTAMRIEEEAARAHALQRHAELLDSAAQVPQAFSRALIARGEVESLQHRRASCTLLQAACRSKLSALRTSAYRRATAFVLFAEAWVPEESARSAVDLEQATAAQELQMLLTNALRQAEELNSERVRSAASLTVQLAWRCCTARRAVQARRCALETMFVAEEARFNTAETVQAYALAQLSTADTQPMHKPCMQAVPEEPVPVPVPETETVPVAVPEPEPEPAAAPLPEEPAAAEEVAPIPPACIDPRINVSARLLQGFFRMLLVRKQVRADARLRAAELRDTVECEAVVMLQSFLRSLRVRQEALQLANQRQAEDQKCVEHDAALAIQSVGRGWLARRRYRALCRQHEASRRILRALLVAGAKVSMRRRAAQRRVHHAQVSRFDAVCVIQAAAREKHARNEVCTRRAQRAHEYAHTIQDEAAHVIAKFMRRAAARSLLGGRATSNASIVREEACIAIQAFARGCAVRQAANPLFEKRRRAAQALALQEERVFACLTIQAWFRGCLQRLGRLQ